MMMKFDSVQRGVSPAVRVVTAHWGQTRRQYLATSVLRAHRRSTFGIMHAWIYIYDIHHEMQLYVGVSTCS
jgi:hypothetical protein